MADRSASYSPRRIKPVSLGVAACFALCGMSLVFGLAMILTLSPAQKSSQTLARAVQALSANNPQLAQDLAFQSLSYRPENRDAWHVLSAAYDRQGQGASSDKARGIVFVLAHKTQDASPAYAVPADLRLSFLAMRGEGSF